MIEGILLYCGLLVAFAAIFYALMTRNKYEGFISIGSFTPRILPNLAVWLDGKDPLGTGTLPSAGSTLATWVDKSGNGYNGNAIGAPTWSSGVSVSPTDYYITPYSIAGNIETSFIVCSIPNTSVTVLLQGSNNNSRQLFTNGANLFINYQGVSTPYSSGFKVKLNKLQLVDTLISPSSIISYLNGTQGVSNTGTYAFTNSSTQIGGSLAIISEIIIYKSILSRAERQSIEQYLMNKWGIPAESPPPPAGCSDGRYDSAELDAIRLYTQEECNSMDGIWHQNGECTKKTGGSYSWDCRNQTSPPAPCAKGRYDSPELDAIRLYTQAECEGINGIWHQNGECTKKTGGSYSWDCRNQTSPPTIPSPSSYSTIFASPVPAVVFSPSPSPSPSPLPSPSPSPSPSPLPSPSPSPSPSPTPVTSFAPVAPTYKFSLPPTMRMAL